MNVNAAVTEESWSEGLVLCISTKSNHIRFGRPILHNERCRLSQIVQCIWQWRTIQRWKRESMPTWNYLCSKDNDMENQRGKEGSIQGNHSHTLILMQDVIEIIRQVCIECGYQHRIQYHNYLIIFACHVRIYQRDHPNGEAENNLRDVRKQYLQCILFAWTVK